MIVITNAQTSDVATLRRLECAHFSESDSRLSTRAFYYHIKRNLLFVAKDDHDIVGYILCLCPNKPYARIYSLLVIPAFRGHGVARRLITCVLKALEGKYPKIFLEVRERNQHAIGLYENFEFKRMRRLEDYYGEKEHGIKMCKVLNYVKIRKNLG